MLCHLFRGAGPAQDVEMELDGRRMRLHLHALVVANLQRIGKYMRIAPEASAVDGKLHVFALEASGSRLAVALSALRTLRGSAGRNDGVRLFFGRKLTLHTEGATPFCADGETRLHSSAFQFEVIPGGSGLLCPRETASFGPSSRHFPPQRRHAGLSAA
jgi:diacylglycerol kinase family enzyme